VISCEAYRRLFIKLDSIFYAAGLSVLPNIKALARPRQQTVPARMPLHTCSHQHMHAQNLVVALAPACRLSPPGMPPKSTTHAACQGRPTRSCPSSMSVCVSLLLPFRRRDLSPVSPRLCAQGRDGYKSRPSILPHTNTSRPRDRKPPLFLKCASPRVPRPASLVSSHPSWTSLSILTRICLPSWTE
jgi:hypothetical protein